MKEYLNEGLILHTQMYYTLQRGKRVWTDTKPVWTKKNDTWFEFDAYMYPPLMLLPTTWQRYGYIADDVHVTYEKMDASYVWQIALMLLCGVYEPEAASAGVRPTFQSPYTFLFIARKSVFDAFVTEQREFISDKSTSVLCVERTDHKPCLPKVSVTTQIFEEAKSMVPSRHPSFCWRPEYTKLFPFKDITLVPVEYDEVRKLVYMVRIVKKSVYDTLPIKPKLCIVTMPVSVMVADIEYILTEEACFIYSLTTSKPVQKSITHPTTTTTSRRKRVNASEDENLPTTRKKTKVR
jgi:hypothetical protein